MAKQIRPRLWAMAALGFVTSTLDHVIGFGVWGLGFRVFGHCFRMFALVILTSRPGSGFRVCLLSHPASSMLSDGTYRLHCSSLLGSPFGILNLKMLKPKDLNYTGDCRYVDPSTDPLKDPLKEQIRYLKLSVPSSYTPAIPRRCHCT